MSINIKRQITFSTVIISLLSVSLSIVFIIWQSNKSGQEVLLSIEKDRLTSVRYFKALQIETYFNNLIERLSVLAYDYQIIDALQDLSKAFPKYLSESKNLNNNYKSETINKYLQDFSEQYKYYNLGKEIDIKKFINLISENSFALQYNYIFNNKYAIEDKQNLAFVDDGSSYSVLHNKYHTLLQDIKKRFGFYDIFLVDGSTGDIVYTVNKEVDFTTSLINGPYATSGLGKVFQNIMRSDKHNFIAIADFAPYLASYDHPEAFMGTALFDSNGNKIGAIIVELSIQEINNIMTDSNLWKKIGPGKTLNASIIGPDYTFRNNNRFIAEDLEKFLNTLKKNNIDQNTIDLIRVKKSIIGILKNQSVAAKHAFTGKEGFVEYTDYRGVPVAASVAPLNIPGLNWIMEVKINQDEALTWATKLKKKMVYNGFLIAIIAGVIAIFLGKITADVISNVIKKIANELNIIAKSKDLTKRLTTIEDSEFSVMVNAFNNFIESLQRNLTNIVTSSNKSKITARQLSENPDEKTDLLDLYEQIKDLSEEFKILEEKNDKMKYW